MNEDSSIGKKIEIYATEETTKVRGKTQIKEKPEEKWNGRAAYVIERWEKVE